MQGVISFILMVFSVLSSSLTDANELQSNTSTSKCKHSPIACGMPGMPGTNSIPGIPGVPGSQSRDGTKGTKGNMGAKGETGKTGATGRKGEGCHDDPTGNNAYGKRNQT